NKKKEERIAELKEFIARFSANAAKSKQATSRKKMLDKIEIDDIKPSSRRYPYVGFSPEREIGNDILKVKNLSHSIDGKEILKDLNFTINHKDKVVNVSDSENQKTVLLEILAGVTKHDESEVIWGVTTTQTYIPKDNSKYFEGVE